jgi:uncharacterized membrane protein YcjF (UPF0283 family)
MSEKKFIAENQRKQDKIGWAYIIMACLSIAVTIGTIIFNLIRTAFLEIKQKYFKNKDKAVKGPAELRQKDENCMM